MAGYEVRSLGQLSTEARGYFAAAIEGAQVPIWPNSFTVAAKVIAALGHEHELRRGWIYDQIFVSTCADATLDLRAYELGLAREPGSPASGRVSLTAPNGTVAPAGLRFARGDGRTYHSIAAATAVGGAVLIDVEADEIGAAGNAPAGTVLKRTMDVAAPAALGLSGPVNSLIGGVDRETDAALRRRLVLRRRSRPAGGSGPDYDAWAREALPAIDRVFVEPFVTDPGAAWVQFTVTDRENGVPILEQVAIVQAYLSDPVRRPVTARVFVSGPAAVPVNVTISELTPNTADARAAVTAEVIAAIREVAEPGRPSGSFRLRRGVIDAAISRVATGYVLNAPTSSLFFAVGAIPVPGTVTIT